MGKVEDGTTTSDYDEEEIHRTMSINLSVIPCEWEGHKINVLDAPGYPDFVGEVTACLRVADHGVAPRFSEGLWLFAVIGAEARDDRAGRIGCEGTGK